MKHPVSKLSYAALLSLSLGLGPIWEARSETTAPDADPPSFLDGVGKLFVWKPEKSAPVSEKEQKELPAPSASKEKTTGKKDRDAGKKDAGSAGKPLGSWLTKLGKKEPGQENSGPAETEKAKPATVPAATGAATGVKKIEDSTADAAPPEPKTPFRWLGMLGKKAGERETAVVPVEKPGPAAKPAPVPKPVAPPVASAPPAPKTPFRWFSGFGKKGEEPLSAKPPKEGKIAEPPADKSTPDTPSAPPAKPVVAGTSAPAVPVSDDKKNSEPLAAGSAETTGKKSFELFSRRNREEPNLPEIYQGLSGDEAFDLAMKRAKAKLGDQKSQAGQGGISGAQSAAPIEMPASAP